MRRPILIWLPALVLLGGLIAVLVARRERHPIYGFLDVVEHADAFTIDIDVYDPNWYRSDSFHIELTDPKDVRDVAELFASAEPSLASGTQQFIRSPKRDRLVERFSLTATSGNDSQTVKLSTDNWVVMGGSEPVDLKGFSSNALYAWLRAAGRLRPTSRPAVRYPPTTLPAQPNDRHREAVLAYLLSKYPTPPLRDDGEPAYFPEMFYMPQRSELHLLSTPVLAEYLPDTRFYLTEISTNQPEFPEAPVVLSATATADGIDVGECLSPMYTEVRPEFLEPFIGLHTESDSAREKLCFAIAELFAAVTYKGMLCSGRFEESAFVVDLLWNRRHWRDVVFEFDASGCLQQVALVRLHARGRD
jgi:hypothetical protein